MEDQKPERLESFNSDGTTSSKPAPKKVQTGLLAGLLQDRKPSEMGQPRPKLKPKPKQFQPRSQDTPVGPATLSAVSHKSKTTSEGTMPINNATRDATAFLKKEQDKLDDSLHVIPLTFPIPPTAEQYANLKLESTGLIPPQEVENPDLPTTKASYLTPLICDDSTSIVDIQPNTLFQLQLPDNLPFLTAANASAKKEEYLQQVLETAQNPQPSPTDDKPPPALHPSVIIKDTFPPAPILQNTAGTIGTYNVTKSGRKFLEIGGQRFWLQKGADVICSQHLAHVDHRLNTMTLVGTVDQRVVCVPDIGDI
ncbi:putative DNA-directed RNA polymerase III subunit RPC4 [Blattamonas nauphoetae]|uniref:DNA-directed RNA polymerase III subunit RPC4 n=1 Tax=Blattamonas nauphoetae TaxID=2049346 RepID=A0ABQ9XBM3_9EUKA|nr:putative DNA-directed RNA polymerase III subunit RPC4 [Blattamonas nauphoetae]